jgi:hypothetical protein
MLEFPCISPHFAPFFTTHSRTLIIITPFLYDKSTLFCIFHWTDTVHETGKIPETIIAACSPNWASSFLTWRVWGCARIGDALCVWTLGQQFISTLLTCNSSVNRCLQSGAVAIESDCRLRFLSFFLSFFPVFSFYKNCRLRANRNFGNEYKQVTFNSSHFIQAKRFWIWL